jgi:mannose-6-phosphate isomerase-like protein (cupin superfamily)
MTAQPSARSPLVVGPGAGSSVWSLGGLFTTKADAAATEGRFAFVETLATRATEPPLHIHQNEDECWYVLDGAMTFYVGDDAHEATAGTFVLAPRGLPHTFTVDVEPTRVLMIAAPAGFEQFAHELGRPADGEVPPADLSIPPPEVLGPVAERYGIQVVGPPRRAM